MSMHIDKYKGIQTIEYSAFEIGAVPEAKRTVLEAIEDSADVRAYNAALLDAAGSSVTTEEMLSMALEG